jgi:hypothetical protein
MGGFCRFDADVAAPVDSLSISGVPPPGVPDFANWTEFFVQLFSLKKTFFLPIG